MVLGYLGMYFRVFRREQAALWNFAKVSYFLACSFHIFISKQILTKFVSLYIVAFAKGASTTTWTKFWPILADPPSPSYCPRSCWMLPNQKDLIIKIKLCVFWKTSWQTCLIGPTQATCPPVLGTRLEQK